MPGDIAADVAIVGAGYTGLWTAYYLHQIDPTLRVVVVEAEFAGFGASGRNGGWLSALLPMSFETMAKQHGRDRAIALQRTMHDSVDEVARVTAKEGIDCHLAKGGYLNLARNEPQVRRVHELLEYYRSWGFGEEDYRWLPADEASARINASNVLGRRLHPALRGHPPGAAGARAGGDRRARGHHDLREHPRRRARRSQGALRDRHRVGRRGRARHRGLHGPAAGPPPHGRADLLVDDRHRAAARLVLRRGRLGATGDLQR